MSDIAPTVDADGVQQSESPLLPQPTDTRTPEYFLNAVRTKWPVYKDIPDDTLIQGFATKYPEYRDIAERHFGSISRPNDLTEALGNASGVSMYGQNTPLAPTQVYQERAKSSQELISDISKPINAMEALATGQGKQATIDALTGKKPFEAGVVEANALNELGIKGNAQTLLGGTLGTILDAWPMIVDPAARMTIAKQVKNGNIAAAEFYTKKFLGVPQETSLASISPENAKATMGESVWKAMNPADRADWVKSQVEKLKGTGEGQVAKPAEESWYHGGQPGLTTLDEGMVTKFPEEAQRYASQVPNGVVYKVTNPETLEKVTQGSLPGNVNGNFDNIRFSGKGTKVSPILGNQSGAVNPSAIAQIPSAVIGAAKDYVAKVNQPFIESGNLEDNFNRLITQNKESEQRGINLINQINASPKDAIAIYHHIENPSEPITPTQQAQLRGLEVVRQDRQRLFEKLRTNGIPVESERYTPRNAVDKGGVIDRIEQGAKSGAKDLLSQSSPNFKKRVMMALEDENGNRQVVAIKEGKVTGITKGVSTELGNYSLSKNIDLLKSDIAPIQDRMNNLKRALDILDSIKVRPSVPQSRINMLRSKVAGLGSSLMDAVGRGKNIDQYLTKRTAQRIHDALLELKAYTRVKPSENVVLRDRRMATLREKITAAEATINATIDSYDLGKMEDKVFVDKTGKKWSVKDATTKEIESNTKQRYYKNAVVNEVLAHNRLQQIDRAVSFLENYKNSPDFSNVAQSLEGGTPINKDWRMTKWQQFRGYAFEPHTADVLDRFYDEMHRGQDPLKVLTDMNKFMRDVMFFNPSIHVPNVVYHWFTERGLKSFVNPLEYPTLAKTMARAIKAVSNPTSEDYLRILHAGGNLQHMSMRSGIIDLMQKKAYIELSQDKALLANVSKAMGYVNPMKFLQTISGNVTWFTNDVLMIQSILEHEAKGMSIEDAVKETAKGIPDYRIPTHVLKMKWLSYAMRSQNITIFGSYHYGAGKAHGEIAKGLASGKAGKTLSAVDKIAAMTFLAFVLKPQLDKFAKAVSGNPRAESKMAGPLTMPNAAYQLASGQKDFSDVLQVVMTPAIASKTILESAINHQLWGGFQQIRHEGTAVQDEAKHWSSALSPVSQAQRILDNKQTTREFLSSLIGINTPHTTPIERKLLDTMLNRDNKNRLSNQMKDLISNDKIDEADKIKENFNDKMAQLYIRALREKGKDIPDRDEIDNRLMKFYIKSPGSRSMANYSNKKNNNTRFIDSIENED